MSIKKFWVYQKQLSPILGKETYVLVGAYQRQYMIEDCHGENLGGYQIFDNDSSAVFCANKGDYLGTAGWRGCTPPPQTTMVKLLAMMSLSHPGSGTKKYVFSYRKDREYWKTWKVVKLLKNAKCKHVRFHETRVGDERKKKRLYNTTVEVDGSFFYPFLKSSVLNDFYVKTVRGNHMDNNKPNNTTHSVKEHYALRTFIDNVRVGGGIVL